MKSNYHNFVIKIVFTLPKLNMESIAFPNISTGIYGFPKKEAAEIAIKTIQKEAKHLKSIRKITFCTFDNDNLSIYKEMI